MRKQISEIRARGAEIVGHGAILKVLLISLGLVVVAFVIVGMVMSRALD